MTMYPDDFGHYYDYANAMEGVMGTVLGIYLFVLFLTLVAGVAFYVLQAISFYTIAKRRGIRNPWLAWIPVGNNWILGSISDQYQYVKNGKVKNRRKILLGLSIASLISSVLYCMGAFAFGFLAGYGETVATGQIGLFVMLMLLYALVELALAITLYVFTYMSLYDLYVSCDPSNGVLYLLLSIFISVTTPFLLFACRNKDDGMPPRRDAVIQPQPQAQAFPQIAVPRYVPDWKPEEPVTVAPEEATTVAPVEDVETDSEENEE